MFSEAIHLYICTCNLCSFLKVTGKDKGKATPVTGREGP
jgi:hypothetical protein